VVLRAHDHGLRVLEAHLRHQDVVVRRRPRGALLLRLVEEPRLLVEILQGDGVQLAGQQDVMERRDGLLQRRLPGDLPPVLRVGQADPGRPDRRGDLAPRVQGLVTPS